MTINEERRAYLEATLTNYNRFKTIFRMADIPESEKNGLGIWLKNTIDFFDALKRVQDNARTVTQQRKELEAASAAAAEFVKAFSSRSVQNLLLSSALAQSFPPTESICNARASEQKGELDKELALISRASKLRKRVDDILSAGDSALSITSHASAKKGAWKQPQVLVAQRILTFWFTYHPDDFGSVTKAMQNFSIEVFRILEIELKLPAVESLLRRASKNLKLPQPMH
jgi:hypothetical protein